MKTVQGQFDLDEKMLTGDEAIARLVVFLIKCGDVQKAKRLAELFE